MKLNKKVIIRYKNDIAYIYVYNSIKHVFISKSLLYLYLHLLWHLKILIVKQ